MDVGVRLLEEEGVGLKPRRVQVSSGKQLGRLVGQGF